MKLKYSGENPDVATNKNWRNSISLKILGMILNFSCLLRKTKKM